MFKDFLSLHSKICSFLDCLRRKRERLNWQCILGHVTSTESFPGCLLGLYRPDLGSAEYCIDFNLRPHNGRDDSECFCAFQGIQHNFAFLLYRFFTCGNWTSQSSALHWGFSFKVKWASWCTRHRAFKSFCREVGFDWVLFLFVYVACLYGQMFLVVHGVSHQS